MRVSTVLMPSEHPVGWDFDAPAFYEQELYVRGGVGSEMIQQ